MGAVFMEWECTELPYIANRSRWKNFLSFHGSIGTTKPFQWNRFCSRLWPCKATVQPQKFSSKLKSISAPWNSFICNIWCVALLWLLDQSCFRRSCLPCNVNGMYTNLLVSVWVSCSWRKCAVNAPSSVYNMYASNDMCFQIHSHTVKPFYV